MVLSLTLFVNGIVKVVNNAEMNKCEHNLLICFVCGNSNALVPFDKQLAKYPTCGKADFQDVKSTPTINGCFIRSS